MDKNDFLKLFKDEENKKFYAESLQNTKDKLQEMTLNNKENFLDQTKGKLKEIIQWGNI